MTVSRPCYTSREAVKTALELTTPYDHVTVDLAISQASEKIDGMLRRSFYPDFDTRYFDYPNNQLAVSGDLWLEEDEVVEITTLSSGGTVIASSDYFVYPTTPFNRISLDRSANASFGNGDTFQKSISVTGTFGYTRAERLATTITAGINGSQTLVDVANGAAVGVGQLIRIGEERLLVTEKRLVDSGETLPADLTQRAGDTAIPVSDGDAFYVGEEIYLDQESMTIVGIRGNTLIVKRSTSWLSTHALGTAIYVARRLEVIRAATGTTAASALSGADVFLLTPPSLIQQLCLAEAVTTFLQTDTGYARSLGSGSSDGKPSGAGLAELWVSANAKFKRYLTGAV